MSPETAGQQPRRLVVGVGGSDPSFSALEYACWLAGPLGASVETLTVMDVPVPTWVTLGPGDAQARIRDEFDRAMEPALERIEQRAKKVGARHGVRIALTRTDGTVADRLLEAATPDCWLVLGRTGTKRSSRGVLGSNVEAVLRGTPVGLLVTPEVYREPHRVLAAYAAKDLGPLVLDSALAVSSSTDLPLCVVTAGTSERRAAAQISARTHLGTRGSGIRFIGTDGQAPDVVNDEAGEYGLIVVGAHGVRLSRLVLGNVTEAIVRHATGPVLIVRHGRKTP